MVINNLGIAILVLVVVGIVCAKTLAARARFTRRRFDKPADPLNDQSRLHSTYFPVIRQAMSRQDFEFLAARAHKVRRTQRERQQIVLLYLTNLRADFMNLMQLARIVSVLSPQMAASQESQRLRVAVHFACVYRMVLLGLSAGILLIPQLNLLSRIVSGFAFRMQAAMNQLGERAALAVELASAMDRGDLDAA